MRESEESYSELRDFQEIVRGLDEMDSSIRESFAALKSSLKKAASQSRHSSSDMDELMNRSTIGGSGIKFARKHLGWYSHGLHGSAEFRHNVNRMSDPTQVKEAIASFYEAQ